ncbi:MAG: hypothetical protein JWN74_3641 [Acidobacteriaceae bacterium]|nr:hypothetical protein [Acidobacteriaceae bacterium]
MLKFTSKYGKFWKWFQAHEDEIFHFDANREKVFDKLASHLHRVHADLTFEFSSVYHGRREFIVSAGGIRNAFSEVMALVRRAPALPRWQIMAFRQRKDIPRIQCGDRSIERDSVFVDYVLVGDKMDLTIFIEGLVNGSSKDINSLKTVGYLLLDATVGEYDVETKIAGIQFVDALAFPERRRIPLRDLPNVVDGLPTSIQ